MALGYIAAELAAGNIVELEVDSIVVEEAGNTAVGEAGNTAVEVVGKQVEGVAGRQVPEEADILLVLAPEMALGVLLVEQERFLLVR